MRKGRKRGKRRDVDVRNGREMVAGLNRKGRVIDTIWRGSLRIIDKKLNKFKPFKQNESRNKVTTTIQTKTVEEYRGKRVDRADGRTPFL